MKRILILAILFAVFIFSSVSAEVRRGLDDFTNGIKITSNTRVSENVDLEYISLEKITMNDFSEITMIAGNQTDKDSLLGEKSIEMNIDGKSKVRLFVNDYTTLPSVDGNKVNCSVAVDVPQSLIDQIKQANRIVIRFTRVNGSKFIYVLPANALVEWKQVIQIK